MNINDVYNSIKTAINGSPRNSYVAELHVQILKYSIYFENVSGREFCAGVGIADSFGAEFAKMKKIAPRLERAGLNVDLL